MDSNTRFRVFYRLQGMRREHPAPMARTVEGALLAYRVWAKRPTNANVVLTIARRDEGEWILVSEEEYNRFITYCRPVPLPEVTHVNHVNFGP